MVSPEGYTICLRLRCGSFVSRLIEFSRVGLLRICDARAKQRGNQKRCGCEVVAWHPVPPVPDNMRCDVDGILNYCT